MKTLLPSSAASVTWLLPKPPWSAFFQFLSLTFPVTLFSDRLNWGEGDSLQELGRVLN